jgi:hypothetical protein
MCKSAAEGGLRCAAHLKSEIVNHKHNEAWEVIKSAAENGTPFAEPEITEEEKLKIKTKARLDAEHTEYAEKLAEANAGLNAEYRKYDLALSTRDKNEVARYLYESSDAVIQSRSDLAKAKRAFDTRIVEIDYNAKAQAESGVAPEEAHTPQAMEKFSAAKKAYDEANKESLRAEDKWMAQMREADAMSAQDQKENGYSDEDYYDQNLSKLSSEAHEKFVQAERELRWAKQDLDVAEDYDRRNYHAVFNPEAEREKAKKQYRDIKAAILTKTSAERKRAIEAAPFALAAYRKGNPDTMRFESGPLRGKFPDAIAKGKSQVSELVEGKEKSLRLAEKKITREVSRAKIAETPEFASYQTEVFPGTERGVAYVAKGAKLHREYRLTETYEEHLVQKRDAAVAAGESGEAWDAEITEVKGRRALHVTATKNNYARSLVSA